MPCRVQRVQISDLTARHLFARAAGHCQRPECVRDLFVQVGNEAISVAEMAHVVAATVGGPRGSSTLDGRERASVENLLLLCPTCHTIVDKGPEQFPQDMLLAWKATHEERIRHLLGIAVFETRARALEAVEPLLLSNRTVFDRYGPTSLLAKDPETEAASTWGRKAREQIVPTNRRILVALDANRHLLNDGERATVEQFRQHVDDFEARHLHGMAEVAATTFPIGMDRIFRDED